MSFNVADLTATLRLDKGSFDSDLAASGRQVSTLGDYASRAGASMRSALTGGVQAASVATVALATVTAVTVKNLFNMGKEYNTLQQTSRAALSTLLGGATAANVQMDKLDVFAKTSPFSKSVFITAQQQLIGFGTAAERVVPTLSAVNDAVAAIGGSNDDIAAISFTLAQVTGTGKITGETLMQLGARGINAAQLIADGMGMTVEETRTAITKGTIDSSAALTALVDQMQIKFAGASANVKETMTGASDRVAAATRDIGAALAEPFVSKYGGGRLVQWTNDWADALRAVEKQVPGVVNVLTARFAPELSKVSVLIGDVKTAAQNFDVSTLNRGLDTMAKNAPAIGALSGAVLAFSGNALKSVPIIGGLVGGLNPLALAILGVVAASPQLRSSLGDGLGQLRPLIPVVVSLAGSLSGALTAGIGAVVPLLTVMAQTAGGVVEASLPLVKVVGAVADGFSQLPGPVQTAVVAALGFLALNSKFSGFGTAVGGAFTGLVPKFQGFRDEMNLQRALAGPMTDSYRGIQQAGQEMAVGAEVGARRFSALGTASVLAGRQIGSGIMAAGRGLVSFLGGPWGIALMAGAALLGVFASKQAEAKGRVDEHTAALDQQTGAITNANAAIAAQGILDHSNDGFYLFTSGAKSASESLQALGKSIQQTAQLTAEGGAGYDSMVGSLREGIAAFDEAAPQFDAMGNSTAGNTDRLDAWAASMGRTRDTIGVTSSDLIDLVGVLEQQRGAVGGAVSDWEKLNDATGKGTPVTLDLAAAIAKVGDESATTSERVSAYKDIIDQLNGKIPTADEQQRNLAKSSRTLAEFFGEVNEAGERMHGSLVDASTGAVALTDAGDQLQGMLGPLQERGLAAALAASDLAKANGDAAGASAAADAALRPFRQTLQNLADQGFLTQDQVDKLADSLFGVPGNTTAIITDKNSSNSVRLQVEELTRKIGQVPNKQVNITEPMSPAVIAQLQNLGYVVQTLPDGTINVQATGIANAENAINWTARERTAIIRAHTINTESSDRGYSSGGGVGGLAMGGFVEFYANGGTRGVPPLVPMSATAAIVPANTWRVVGDNAHVPEVYAPLNGSARSLDIMRMGADRMGFTMVPKSSLQMFANGGTRNVAQQGATQTGPTTVEEHTHIHYGNVTTEDPRKFDLMNRRNLQDALALNRVRRGK